MTNFDLTRLILCLLTLSQVCHLSLLSFNNVRGNSFVFVALIATVLSANNDTVSFRKLWVMSLTLKQQLWIQLGTSLINKRKELGQ